VGGFVESFNGRVRNKCRNGEIFATLAEGRALIERLDDKHAAALLARRLDAGRSQLNTVAGRLRNPNVPRPGRYRRHCAHAIKP
jgi:putative transposase